MPTAAYCLADLHLEGFPWSRREEFYGDSFRALESAQQVILNDTIVPDKDKVVFLSGDITNKKAIEDDTAMALRMFIAALHAKGIAVYYVNGNHDMSLRTHMGHVGVFGGVHIHEQHLQIGDFTVYGLDWVPRGELHEKLKNIPGCDILFLHCAFKHLLSFEGAYDLDMEDLPEHLTNVFVGDVHVTDVSQNKHGTNVVSPGPLHPCAISQPGPHGMMRIVSDTRKWEFLEIDTRHVLDYKLEDYAGMDALTLAETIKGMAAAKKLKPHCVLRYNSEDSDRADKLISLLKDLVFIHEKKSNHGHLMTFQQRADMLSTKEETSLEKEAMELVELKPDDGGVSEFVLALLTGDAVQLLEAEVAQCSLPSPTP